MPSPFVIPTRPPFAPKKVTSLRDFTEGLNDKFSSLLIDPKEVQAIRNFNFDEKGALTKRKGYTKHYAASFATNATRDMTNYRKQDGTSRLVLAADDKLFYDKPQFIQTYDIQADWALSGTTADGITTTEVPGDIKPVAGSKSAAGHIALGSIGARAGGTPAYRQTIWRSNTLDITAVQDKTTGKVANTLTAPAGTTVVLETRVSPDGTTWDPWLSLGASNSIQTVGTRPYLQIRVRFNSTQGRRASAQIATVTFDTTPTVTVLASGLSMIARYTFATQNDILYIANGTDANRKWDGVTFGVQGGAPPTGKYITVHKNIMFLAGNGSNPSRLYFSALADPETWPALNFIDVAKGDGDQITGLAILLDRLVIIKQNSVWLLEGDASSNFILRRVTDEAGCVDMHSIVVVKNTLGMLARDGFYFFDGVRMALASEKIATTFATLNSSQFGLVAGAYFPSIRKVFISVPSGVATANNTVLVFDTLRAAWTVYTGINAASYVIWRQFNTDHLLFGDSGVGQVYDAETGYNDNGAAIAASVTTKSLDLGGSELEKFLTEVLVDAKETSGTGNATMNISFFKNLNTTESTITATTVTGAQINVLRVIPSSVQVGNVRDVAVKIAESSTNRSVTIYGLALSYTPKLGLRAT